VVPVRGSDGELIAVFDIDSEEADTFDDVDRDALERIVQRFARS
jgi:GAF domain-containing protein